MCKALQSGPSHITGIGYVFDSEDPYIGIDIDDCFDDGKLNPATAKIVKWADSYTERSVSGAGLHIIVKGMLPQDFANKISMEHVGFKCLEIYDSARYFTMTGDIYGEPKPIRAVNMRELKIPTMQSGNRSKSAPPPNPQHKYLIEQIRESEDSSLFQALFDHGDLTRYDGDQSRGDLALVNIIAKWTKFDPQLTDCIYRRSALMRPKWDKKHKSDGSTYGEMTIRKALDNKRIAGSHEHEGFLQYHYDFRFNVVTSRTEVHIDGRWQMLNDYNFNSIHRHMRNCGAKVSAQKLHSLLGSDFVEKYHPFEEYFHGLSK